MDLRPKKEEVYNLHMNDEIGLNASNKIEI